MNKITTQKCKEFLVKFFQKNKSLLNRIYDGEEELLLLNTCTDIKKWKRETKCKPGSENSYLTSDLCSIYEFGKDYPKGVNYSQATMMKSNLISCERTFVFNQELFDSSIMFLVLEDFNGSLYLGEYVGD